jgi:tetrahydromethanopterin S-methyltransferase subunit C
MSAAGGGPAGAAIEEWKTLALGVVGGLVGIYVCAIGFNPVISAVFASLAGLCAIVWGSDAIRSVAAYGLGTGVPSIGYMSLSVGVIGAIAGLAAGIGLGIPLLAPIVTLVISALIGFIIAFIGKKIVGMKIPVLEKGTAQLAGAAGLSILAFSSVVAGGLNISDIVNNVFATGVIGLLFIMNTMAIQHPFNACLGPNEDQVRTLKLSAACGFLSMTIVGLIATIFGFIGTSSLAAGVAVTLIGIVGWIVYFRAFVSASYDAAASVKWAGLWPKQEEQ